MTKPTSSQPKGIFARLFDQPVLILCMTAAFWGGNTVAGKIAVGEIDPYTLTVLRWAGALLCVLPFAQRQMRTDFPRIREKWPLLLFYGAIGYATFNILIYLSAYYTSGVNIAIEQVMVNIIVMLGNFVLFRVRVRFLQIVGVVLTIIGVAITATHGDPTRLLELDINIGDGIVLLACLVYASYSLTLRFRPAVGWLSFLVATFSGALLGAFVYQFLLGGGLGGLWSGILAATPTGWMIVVYVLIFPSIFSQLLYVRGVELIGPNRASLFINLIPLFGTLGAVLVLGEQLEGFHLIAGALIAIGIVLAEWAARRSVGR
ncbi:membrane protein [Devosia pacifica]|uniref:Membrane protein n=1 Tax=Devosia pacifica TaxID=1335967 RepID=A0A918S9L7_9HYPH|nr:DMT family transporter [Devosia pacifica]GHA28027.1 membrane protein [Devosia pacifica]